MEYEYEAPELILIGDADEVVMGTGPGGDDFPQHVAIDFEFEEDYSAFYEPRKEVIPNRLAE